VNSNTADPVCGPTPSLPSPVKGEGKQKGEV
jgi:hypothetical protein